MRGASVVLEAAFSLINVHCGKTFITYFYHVKIFLNYNGPEFHILAKAFILTVHEEILRKKQQLHRDG